MTTWVNPYIFFDGNAKEAFEFYQSIFGGTLNTLTGAQFGLPEEQAERIMHAHLETADGWTIMGADGDENESLGEVQRMNLTIGGPAQDLEKVEGWYAQLAEGGAATFPLEKQQWGDVYGQVKDKYGVTWAFNMGNNG